MGQRYAEYNSRDELADYLPSPDQIRRECEAIQRTWSPEETRRRAPWAYAAEEIDIRNGALDLAALGA